MRPLQRKIISALKVKPEIDPKREIRRSVDFIKSYLQKYPFLQTLVLGVSGGQDSTLTGKLCEMAVTELRRSAKNQSYQFIAVRLPYGEQADEADAMEAIKYMHADRVMRVNIKSMTDDVVKTLKANGLKVSDFNKGNVKARERMVAQYAIAGQTHGVVVGTDHAAEAVTGFYTKYGDGASDIAPIWRLDKRQGKQMLKVLNAPAHLYQKVPTADLEDGHPGLPDEAALGVRYKDIDAYLEGRQVSDHAASVIENWYRKTAHKRHLPINVYSTFWK